VAQVVECLPSKHKAQSSTTSINNPLKKSVFPKAALIVPVPIHIYPIIELFIE
jgi:hypothetical protein